MYSVDLTLYHIDGFIITDVYSKPTDSHLYLPPSSCHPKHVFKAIPFGVATRLKRNCSDETFFAERTAEYKGYLLNQGYPSTISRNDLLRTRAKEAKKSFPFVITFNPKLPDVGNIITKHLFILQSNPKLKELFPRGSVIPAFIPAIVVSNAREIDATFVRISLWNPNRFPVFGRQKIQHSFQTFL